MSDDPRLPTSDSSQPAPPASSAARVMGGIFLVFGILVMGLSGLCSGVFLISGLATPSGGSLGNSLELLRLVAIIGGIPFVVGLFFFWLGRRMRKNAA